MLPSRLQATLAHEGQIKASRPRTVTWLCMPYFCLEKYSDSRSSSRPSSHPMTTLLQARFSLVQKERDMQQAVCHLHDAPAEHCFHIAQTWCLVLDDCELQYAHSPRESRLTHSALLVTCARLPMSALQGESISITSGPIPGNSAARSSNLLVSGGSSLLWSFPLDQCQSWFVGDTAGYRIWLGD